MEKNEQVIMYRYSYGIKDEFKCMSFLMENKDSTLKFIKSLDEEKDPDWKPLWTFYKKIDLDIISSTAEILSIASFFRMSTLNDSPEKREDFITKCRAQIFDDIVSVENFIQKYVVKIKTSLDVVDFDKMYDEAKLRYEAKPKKHFKD